MKTWVYPVSRSRDLTQGAIRALEAAGHKVIWDWTKGPERHYDERDEAIAIVDFKACRDCDVLFMMWAEGMKGAYTEFGMAYALNRRCIVVGCNDRNDNIFLRLPEVEFFDTLGEAIEALT